MPADHREQSAIADIFHDLYPDTEQPGLSALPDIQLTDIETLSSELGFSIWYNQIDVQQDSSYQVNIPAGLHFSFCFGGEMRTSAPNGSRGDMSGYMQNLMYLPEMTQMSTHIKKQPVFAAFGISFTPEFLQRDNHAAKVARLLAQQQAQSCFLVQPLQPEIQQVIENVYRKPLKGPGALLVAEGLALQILGYWLALEQQSQPSNYPNARQAIKVKTAIDQQTQQWFSSEQWAKESGLSVQALNNSFRQLFECSLNDYIRHRKLRVGQGLLLEGLNVSQAAYQLDYSPQYFSEFFKQKFGCTPKQFQLNNRKNITDS